MSDRQGAGGTYTPNRKPRKSRGGGNTPRGTPRGRGQQGGQSSGSDLQSPSVTSSAQSNPIIPEPTPPQPKVQEEPPSVPSYPVSPLLSKEVKSTPSEDSPASSKPKKGSMESPMEKTVTSASSTETFLTPTSVTEPEKGQDSRTESYESRKVQESDEEKYEEKIGKKPSAKDSGVGGGASATPPQSKNSTPIAKSKEDLEKPEDEEDAAKSAKETTQGPATSRKNSVPEKPPRKSSVDGKDKPKLFEAPVEQKAPRASGEPPETIDIKTADTSSTSMLSANTGVTVVETGGSDGQTTTPSASASEPISITVDSRPSSRSRKSSVSPSGFAYGLGGPVGRPAYGMHTHQDDDDPWPAASAVRSRKVSMAEVKEAAKGFTRRQWTTLIMFGLADMFSAIVISLQAPFYPAEAERKGATATEYGLVFGIYELIVFLTSPIYGKYMNKLGPRLVFNLGITISALSCICFGLLDNINDHTLFISLSFLFRCTEAIGASAFVTASFTIIAFEFPESVATTFASLETFFGLGLIVGPTVGGALYQLGGYTLPFAVTGASLLIVALLSTFVMPKIEVVEDEHGNATEGYGIFSILKIPAVLLAGFTITMSASTLGFLSATLEPHLRQFMLTPVQTGLMFIVNGGTYAMCAPAMGWICDKTPRPILITFLGSILIFAGFLLIGPAPFIPIDTILWVTGVGLLVHGIGLAATFVAGFISALRDSMEYGFPDNVSTYGVVSGLWTSSLSLGAFVGPSVGGALLDNFGFRNASYYTLIGQLIVIALIIVYLIVRPKLKKSIQTDAESAPLLRSNSPPGLGNDSEKPSTSAGYGATG